MVKPPFRSKLQLPSTILAPLPQPGMSFSHSLLTLKPHTTLPTKPRTCCSLGTAGLAPPRPPPAPFSLGPAKTGQIPGLENK